MRLQNTFYIDGKANFKVEELMEVAASKYKMLVKNGSWKTTEFTDNPFVALTAEAEFDCKPVQVNANINRVGGAIQLTHKGTVTWSFQDNEGRPHAFLIKDSYYAPNAPCWLLSPLHWSQNTADNASRKGTWSATYFNRVELHWSNNNYHRTIALDPATNIAAICSSPGH